MDTETRKTVIIIPAYQPTADFVHYAKSLLAKSEAALLVVDDGSGEAYRPIFSAVSALPRTTLLTHSHNRGKGAAMKSAFRYALAVFEEGTTYAVADCDGQHTVKDVLRVLTLAKKEQDCLILGVRDFKNAAVPLRSRLGNTAMVKIFERFAGVSLSDTQTGLRGFSHTLLPHLLDVEGERFSYETRMLLALHERGFLIKEIKIQTVYRCKSSQAERDSHFRPLRDSLEVLGVLFSSFGIYVISSAVSALLDVLLFYVFSRFAFSGFPSALSLLLATLLARVLSSIVNFLGNRLAFRGSDGRAALRYYTLWLFQLSASYGFTLLLGRFMRAGLLLSATKGGIDLILAFFSYHIQKRWVFAPKKSKNLAFYGFYFRLARFFVRPFLKKYTIAVSQPEEPSVYLSRHLNMKGPITLAAFMPFDTHFFALWCFFRFSTCFKQYSRYTFTARYSKGGLRRIFGTFLAFFAALVVPPLLRSMRAIPVYRGADPRAASTLKQALACLERGESVTVFADVDYALQDEGNQSIYKGFLLLEKRYFKKVGKHLAFCVLGYDEANCRVLPKKHLSLVEGEPFKTGALRLEEEITEALFSEAKQSAARQAKKHKRKGQGRQRLRTS